MMYTWFYGFSEEPFSVNPDPKFLYLTQTHKQTLDDMVQGIEERKGFVVAVGELGSGKTTLIQHLLGTVEKSVKAVAVFHPPATLEELLEDTLGELGVAPATQSKGSLVSQFNDYLHRLSPDETLALIIDEAHDLSPEILEDLRLLPTPEAQSFGKLQIVLVGEPELEDKLESVGLRDLRQRIEAVSRIEPLSGEESRLYIGHRLQMVESETDKVLTPEAVELICQYGKGNPRTINTLCDNAFLVGYGLSKKKIDSAILLEVLEDLDFIDPEPGPESKAEMGRRSRSPSARVKSLLLPKVLYSLLALAGVGGIILLGRVFLKGPEEAAGPRFPIEVPAAKEAGGPPSEGKPEAEAQAVPRAGAEKAPSDRAPGLLPPAAGILPAREAAPPPAPAAKEAEPAAAGAPPQGKPAALAPIKEAKPAPPAAERPPSAKSGPGGTVAKPGPPSLRSPAIVSGKTSDGAVKKTVEVKRGDSIYSLAAQSYRVANTSVVERVLEANPAMRSPNRLSAGQKIILPEINEESLVFGAGDGTYKIRLGTFLKAEYAAFLKGEAVLRGKPMEIAPQKLASGETWYRAMAGKFQSRDEALKAVRELRQKGLSPYFPGFRKKK